MTVVAERVAKLRSLMAEKGIDAYVVPTADFHQSEYVGEHFKARKFITGFSGSYGTAVITKDDGGLWTDGRYFFQAENELKGSGIRLMKMFVGDTPSVTEYLCDTIPEGGTVGFDGRVLSMGEGQEYEEALSAKNIRIEYSEDLIRYAAECARGMQLPIKYMDKLLSEWKRAGVSDVESARAAHESHGKRAPESNPALHYEQRAYTEKDFEGFFVDLTDGENK